jgi:hypothetical protein
MNVQNYFYLKSIKTAYACNKTLNLKGELKNFA